MIILSSGPHDWRLSTKKAKTE